MVKANVKRIGAMLPCRCGGGTWLKKTETTLCHRGGEIISPTYTERYAVYCDVCGREVETDSFDNTVLLWNKLVTGDDRQSRTGRLVEH